jgi:hypothetical protein
MVYEDRVEQTPVRVCRMEPVVETVRVARMVEKRVPVECSYYVPRVVCYPTAVDACGTPVEYVAAPSISTSAPATRPAQPTLAAPQKKTSAADEKPKLPPESTPGPVDAEKSVAPPAGGKTESKTQDSSSGTAYPIPKSPGK